MPPRLLHHFFDATRHTAALEIPPGWHRPRRVVLTYAELSGRADAIGQRLPDHEAVDAVVALFLPRTSPDAFAAILAVLRAGCAYVVIDPAVPDARVRAILDDATPIAILTDAAGQRRLRSLAAVSSTGQTMGPAAPRVVNVAAASSEAPRTEGAAPSGAVDERSLAYLVYTSGSTGGPKGVMVEHRAIVNLVASDIEAIGVTPTSRVAQGSSLAYDSSIEEIWLAWAVGATVVVLDDDAVRSGPDLAAWLDRERIDVFCPPPTLLRTIGGAEVARRLTHLAVLYVGGEALTADVVDAWAPGRRLINGYGPTECAVVALRADVRVGEPITIGRPVPNVVARVLREGDEDGVEVEVGPGETGELCLGGVGLARGYWRAPDLTARKFRRHPTFGVLYHTGDLVRQLPDGDFVYIGRADTQVKVRGHRLEIEEVESHLARLPGVRAAACRLVSGGGSPVLAAFVVASEAERPPAPDDMRRALQHVLPAHAVPQVIELVSTLPRTIGGKLDRARLPDTVTLSPRAAGEPPRDDLERQIAACLATALATGGAPAQIDTIDRDAHFFEALGGDSVRAAQWTSALRGVASTAALTVRDVYEAPTVAALAARARTQASVPEPAPAQGRPHPTEAVRSIPRVVPLLVTLAQGTWLALEGAAAAWLAYLVCFSATPAFVASAGPITAILLAPVLIGGAVVAYALAALAFAVAVKWTVIGRYRPCRVPVWSTFYLRHWIVQQASRLVPWRLFTGTELQAVAWRALGARIGRRVHLHRGVSLAGGWDLVDIGDDTTVNRDVGLHVVDLDAGDLVTAPIAIGSSVTIDVRASIAGGVTIGEGSAIGPQASLAPCARVAARSTWEGIPAVSTGPAPLAPAAPTDRRVLSPWSFAVARVLGELALAVAVTVPADLLFAGLAWWAAVTPGEAPHWFGAPMISPAFALTVLAAGPLTVAWSAILHRALGRIEPGVHPIRSGTYLRVWLKADLLDAASAWLSGTLMWPRWLRAAGMTIGRGCEISTIIDAVPELITVGDESFLADGIYLAGPRLAHGQAALQCTRVGSGVFLGNHAIVPAGQTLADGVLVGVSTLVDEQAARPHTSWFGHPPFALARPASTWDRRVTHDPSFVRRLNRWIWELSRFAIPLVGAAVGVWWLATLAARASKPASLTLFATVVVVSVLAVAALTVFVLALKWLLLGRVRPGAHPLWSCWCSRWDFLYVAWAQLAGPVLAPFEGTLWLNWYLRAMGARIGRGVILGPGFAQVVDPDMLTVESGATVHALLQAHTFEEHVLKIDHVRIGARATVGHGVVLLYGADVGADARVVANSVVMKHEHVPPGRVYAGCPLREVR